MLTLKSGLVLVLAGFMSIATVAAESEILVERGALKISKQEFANFLDVAIPAQSRGEALGSQEQRRKLLAEYYVLKQLALEGRIAGTDQDPEYVARLAYMRDELLAKKYLNEQVNKKMPDLEKVAKERYVEKKKTFVEPEQVDASHILIAVNGERDESSALVRAKEAIAKAKAGESFEKLVETYSDDPSAKTNKGDLGFFSHDRMVEPFADAAFALKKKGDMSGPVKTQFGYHVIRLNERKPAVQKTFEQVKSELIAEVGGEFAKKYTDEELARIRGYEDVKINYELLETFTPTSDAK